MTLGPACTRGETLKRQGQFWPRCVSCMAIFNPFIMGPKDYKLEKCTAILEDLVSWHDTGDFLISFVSLKQWFFVFVGFLENLNTSNQIAVPQGEPQERLALYLLHHLKIVVPEHVETRRLIHPSHPGLTQVDNFFCFWFFSLSRFQVETT